MKTASASDASKAAEVAHIAQVTYEQALKLKNLPTLKFELYGGMPQWRAAMSTAAATAAAAAASASALDKGASGGGSPKRVSSRGNSRGGTKVSSPSTRSRTHSRTTAHANGTSTNEIDIINPKDIPGTKEWASQLTFSQLSLLSTKQSKLLLADDDNDDNNYYDNENVHDTCTSIGADTRTNYSDGNDGISSIGADGGGSIINVESTEPNRGQFLGIVELTPAMYLQHCLPALGNIPKNEQNFIDSQAVIAKEKEKAERQKAEEESALSAAAAAVEKEQIQKQKEEPEYSHTYSNMNMDNDNSQSNPNTNQYFMDCDIDHGMLYKLQICLHAAEDLPGIDPRLSKREILLRNGDYEGVAQLDKEKIELEARRVAAKQKGNKFVVVASTLNKDMIVVTDAIPSRSVSPPKGSPNSSKSKKKNDKKTNGGLIGSMRSLFGSNKIDDDDDDDDKCHNAGRGIQYHVPTPYAIIYWNNRELGRTNTVQSPTINPVFSSLNNHEDDNSVGSVSTGVGKSNKFVFFIPNLLKYSHACMKNELRIELWDASPSPAFVVPIPPSISVPSVPVHVTNIGTVVASVGSTGVGTGSFGPQDTFATPDPTLAPPTPTATTTATAIEGTAANATVAGEAGVAGAEGEVILLDENGLPLPTILPPVKKMEPVFSNYMREALRSLPSRPSRTSQSRPNTSTATSTTEMTAVGSKISPTFLGCLSLRRESLIKFLHSSVGVPRTSVNYKKRNDGTTTIEPYTDDEREKGTRNNQGTYGNIHHDYSRLYSIGPDPRLTAEEIEEQDMTVQGMLKISLRRCLYDTDVDVAAAADADSTTTTTTDTGVRAGSFDNSNSSANVPDSLSPFLRERQVQEQLHSQLSSMPATNLYSNPSIRLVPHTLLLGPTDRYPTTHSYNQYSTGGVLNIQTHIQDAFLSTAAPDVASLYLQNLALTVQALLTEIPVKNHNYIPSSDRLNARCHIQSCEGCYNQYKNDTIPCIVKNKTYKFPLKLAMRSQEGNEIYPFNFGIRLRKTPINALVGGSNIADDGKYAKFKNMNEIIHVEEGEGITKECSVAATSASTTVVAAAAAATTAATTAESDVMATSAATGTITNTKLIKYRDPQVNTHCYFHCLANDKCRRNLKSCGMIEYDCRDYLPTNPHNHLKGTIAGVPIIPYKPSFSEMIQEHLEREHWTQLVQFNFMDEQIYAERQANMKRKSDEALMVELVGVGAGGSVIVKSQSGSVHGSLSEIDHTSERGGGGKSISVQSPMEKNNIKNSASVSTTMLSPIQTKSNKLLMNSASTSLLPLIQTEKIGRVPAGRIAGTTIVPSTTGPSHITGPHTKKEGIVRLGKSGIGMGSGIGVSSVTGQVGKAAGSGANAAKSIK